VANRPFSDIEAISTDAPNDRVRPRLWCGAIQPEWTFSADRKLHRVLILIRHLLRVHDRGTATPRTGQGDGEKGCGDHFAMIFPEVGSVKHIGHDGAMV
jgi:hypothetical protein